MLFKLLATCLLQVALVSCADVSTIITPFSLITTLSTTLPAVSTGVIFLDYVNSSTGVATLYTNGQPQSQSGVVGSKFVLHYGVLGTAGREYPSLLW